MLFIDPQLQEIWIPDKPYTKGSWGYMDGKPFNSWPGSSHDGVRYGVGADIKILFRASFQTFLIGTTCYRLDVPDGVYEIGFYFTEPFSKDERKILCVQVFLPRDNVYLMCQSMEKIDRFIESG